MKHIVFYFCLINALIVTSNGFAQDTGEQKNTTEEKKSDQRLFELVFEKDFEGVKRLIEAGSNVNSTYDGAKYEGSKSWSFISMLAVYGQLELIKLAVQKGGDIHLGSKEDRDRTPIYYAAEYGETEVVRYLQSLGVDINTVVGGDTPLIYAITSSRASAKGIQSLIDLGADPNIAWGGKKGNNSPVYYAINNQKFAVLKTLIENGASLQYTNTSGVPAQPLTNDNYVAAALSTRNVEIFNYILSKSNYKKISEHTTALHIAVGWNFPYAIHKLLALGLSKTEKDKKGRTPLDIAIKKEYNFAQSLLLYGATEDDKKLFQLMEDEAVKKIRFHPSNIWKALLKKEVTTLKGDTLVVSEVLQDKKLTFINFWATWCGPCVKEMPALQKLQEQLKEEVQIVAVSTDQERYKISNFDQERGPFSFRYFHDPKWEFYKTFRSSLPGSFLLNSEGRIIISVKSSFDWGNPKVIELIKLLSHHY